MADFIDKDYFIGTINLPKDNYDDILLFITQFEKKVLIELLGYTLYKAMKAGESNEPYKSLIEGKEYEIEYNGNTRKVKWNGLKNNDKISLIAYYVYCYYMRNKVSTTQSLGETKSIQENSTNANIFGKVMGANSFFEDLYGYDGQSKLIPSAYNFLDNQSDLYPDWEFTNMIGNFNSHDL